MLLLPDRPRQALTEENEADALIREARRLRRRRWMRRLASLITVAAFISLVVAEMSSSSSRSPIARIGRSSPAVPGGALVTPRTPASLAVGPNGDLYVLDAGRDQILRRTRDGRFQVVAGTGRQGFSRDGVGALDARLRLQFYSGLAGGGSEIVRARPIRAGAALLASGRGSSDEVTGLAIGPNHELYIGLATGVYRLTSRHMLVHVIGSQVKPSKVTAWNGNPGNPEDFLDATRLSFDREGDLFVVGGGAGWGLYERTTTGALRFIHVVRGGAGCCASGEGAIAADSDGQVITASNFGIQFADAAGGFRALTSDEMRLVRNVNRVVARASKERLAEFRPGAGIATAPDGTIYLDADAGMFSPIADILAVTPQGQVTALWLSRIHKF